MELSLFYFFYFKFWNNFFYLSFLVFFLRIYQSFAESRIQASGCLRYHLLLGGHPPENWKYSWLLNLIEVFTKLYKSLGFFQYLLLQSGHPCKKRPFAKVVNKSALLGLAGRIWLASWTSKPSWISSCLIGCLIHTTLCRI